MKMRFKAKAEDLNEALSTVSIVAPRPVTQKGESGYLFVIRGEQCSVYSRDSQHVARATMKVSDVDGEGAFIYPAAYVDAFKFVGDEIEFDVTSEGDTHIVRYTTASGATAERSSFDAALMTPCDKDLEEAQGAHEFQVAILREAIGFAKPFLAKPTDTRTDEHWKTLQVFDDSKPEWEKGNGYLFGSNGNQAFFFYSPALAGKGLAVHGQHIGALSQFLSKIDGTVTVRKGKNMTFMIDPAGRVLGWVHQTKTHGKFSYYSLKQDKIVLVISVENILKAMRYIRTELDPKRDRVKVVFDETDNTIRFEVSEGSNKAVSWRVPVAVTQNDVNRGFSQYVNINQFPDLFQGVKGQDITLRVTILPADERRPKEGVAFRTLDEFYLDDQGKVVAGSGVKEKPEGTTQCLVTRFMPSMT